MQGVSLLAEDLLAAQEGIYFMELLLSLLLFGYFSY
jgi:hypothetical protein